MLESVEGCDQVVATLQGLLLGVDVVVTQHVKLLQTPLGCEFYTRCARYLECVVSCLGPDLSYRWNSISSGVLKIGLQHAENATCRFALRWIWNLSDRGLGPFGSLSLVIERKELLILERPAHNLVLLLLHVLDDCLSLVQKLAFEVRY